MPVTKYAPAAANKGQGEACTTTWLAAGSTTLAKGELVASAAGEEYAVEDATRAKSAGCPTPTEAAKAATARGWTQIGAEPVDADLSAQEQDARSAAQTTCKVKPPGSSWRTGQLACKPSASTQHACGVAWACPLLDVEDSAAATKTAPLNQDGTGAATRVWADSSGALSERNDAKERPAPATYRPGKHYRKGQLVTHANAVHECLVKRCKPARRGGARPGTANAAAVWGTPVRTAAETAHYAATGTTPPDLSALPAGAEHFAAAWQAGATTYATAYGPGALAVADAGTVWECDPEGLSGKKPSGAQLGRKGLESAGYTNKAGATVAAKTREVEYVVGCAENAPGSAAGAAYWRTAEVDLGAVMPLDVTAVDWEADPSQQYAAGVDHVVHAGAVYKAGTSGDATAEPGTAAGAAYWKRQPWKPADIGKARPQLTYPGKAKGEARDDKYVAGAKKKPRWITHKPALKLPYSKGDVAKVGAAYWTCTGANPTTDTKEEIADQCREKTPGAGAGTPWVAVSPASKPVTEKWPELAEADVPSLDSRTVKAVAFSPTKADYAKGDTVASGPAGYAKYNSAWRCEADACAAAAKPTKAGGWRQTGELAQPVATEPVPVEAWDYQAGVPYQAGAKVVAGGAKGEKGKGKAYECVAALAEQCGKQRPDQPPKPAKAGQAAPQSAWRALPEPAKSKGPEVREEADAAPLDALLAGGAALLDLAKGDSFAYEGAVYECAKGEGACGTALTQLKAVFEADATAARAKPTKASDGTTTYAARKNLGKELRDKLLGGAAGTAQSAFKATSKKPSAESAKKWADAKTKLTAAAGKPDAAVAAGLAVGCDTKAAKPAGAAAGAAATLPTTYLWRSGAVHCDAESACPEGRRAWKCVGRHTCGDATLDPTCPSKAAAGKTLEQTQKDHKAKLETAAFKAAWEEVKDVGKKLLVEKPNTQPTTTAAKTKAFDWAATTAADYTGTAEFAPGDVALDASRVWKCVGSKDSCKSTKPSADAEEKAWALTTLRGQAFTAAEALAEQPLIVKCYRWAEDGYPVQKGDVVCDPTAPELRAWTCLHDLACPDTKPALADAARLKSTWALATEGQRADAKGVVTKGLKQRFEPVAAPKEVGAPVQCQDWDDRERGAADISDKQQLVWCDRGRVFKCVEAPTVVPAQGSAPAKQTRPCCSEGGRPGAGSAACWSQQRQRGTVTKKSAAEADKAFGAPPAPSKCAAATTFGAKGATAGKGSTVPGATAAAWAGDGKKVAKGKLELADGAACASDAKWQQRLASASVTPRAKLGEDATKWPFNVRVADAALPAAAMEKLLAGIQYKDATGRKTLLNVIGWFPGLCGDRAKADARDRKSVCRADVAGAMAFALAGEPSKDEWERSQPSTGAGHEWWQTAFSTAAEAGCHAAEQAKASASLLGHCAQRETVDAKAGSVVQKSDALYYARGAGPAPLRGAADYNAFSRALTGDEAAFGKAPQDVLTWGPAITSYQGQRVGALPIAVALWRYVTPAHAWLPSVHEVVTGLWEPRKHEAAAGLGKKPGDFCTAAAAAAAVSALASPTNKTGQWAGAVDAKDTKGEYAKAAGRAAQVADGSLAAAWRAMREALGLPAGADDAKYDWSCRATKPWPEPAQGDADSRQAVWLEADATAKTCKLVELKPATAKAKGYLSVFGEGDVARCWQDADPAQLSKTVEERRRVNKDARRACQLWSASEPVAWEGCPLKADGSLAGAADAAGNAALAATERCTACVALPTGTCDTACQADAKAAKHEVLACRKPALCGSVAPTDRTDQAKPARDRVWEPVTEIVDKGQPTAGKPGQDTQGENYRVVAASSLAQATKEVPCVSFAEAHANKAQPALLRELAQPEKDSKDPAVANPAKEVVYVCAKGRAYTCKATGDKTAALGTDKAPGAQDASRCLKTPADDPETSTGADKWQLVPGAVGKSRPQFKERWPDCLAASAYPTDQNGQAQKAEFAKRRAQDPLQVVEEIREEWPAGQTGPGVKTTRGTGKFALKAEALPVVVDEQGALCTNLGGKLKPAAGSSTKADKVPRAPDSLASYMQAVGDATLDPAASKALLAAAGTSAQQAIALIEDATSKDAAYHQKAYAGVRRVRKQLTEARFTELTKGAAQSLKLKYWDFLAAVAAAPAFCTAKGAGKLAGLGPDAICARELAGIWALGSANSSGRDPAAKKAAPTAEAKPDKPWEAGWAAQGFQEAKDGRCALPSTDAKRATVKDQCDAGAAPASKTDAAAKAQGTGAFNEADGLCSKGACKAGEKYPPRGPGRLSGVEGTYWFAKLAQGDLTGAKSALKDPTVLESGYEWWLSGVYRWMVPEGGRPAPHNVMTGQWQAGPEEQSAGVSEAGWGAVVKLARPEACGKGARGEEAAQLTESWRAMQKAFKLEAQTETGTSGQAVPLTAAQQAQLLFDADTAKEPKKAASCEGADHGTPFPKGAWAGYPRYLAPTYTDAKGQVQGEGTGRCYATQSATPYVLWERDAYRKCAWANKYDQGKADAQAAKDTAAAKAISDKREQDATAKATDEKCVADAGYEPGSLQPRPATLNAGGKAADPAALAKCPVNKDCVEKATVTAASSTKPAVMDKAKLALCPQAAACLRQAGPVTASRDACLK